MKRSLSLIFFCIAFLINWGAPEPTVEGNDKHKVNFFGKLITHQGQEFSINNISIKNRYTQIIMIDKPATHPNPVFQRDKNRYEIKLDVNPATDFSKTKIDLSETAEIQVPNYNTVWVYQKEKRARKFKYLEVVVISKNENKTKRSYLLEKRTELRCDEIDAGGPLEKVVPLGAIKSLIIEGYEFRNEMVAPSNKKAKKKPAVEPTPMQAHTTTS